MQKQTYSKGSTVIACLSDERDKEQILKADVAIRVITYQEHNISFPWPQPNQRQVRKRLYLLSDQMKKQKWVSCPDRFWIIYENTPISSGTKISVSRVLKPNNQAP